MPSAQVKEPAVLLEAAPNVVKPLLPDDDVAVAPLTSGLSRAR